MDDAAADRKTFRPCAAQTALVPEISGNTINGFGESQPRRPRYVYWHDPEQIAHGPLQQWYYTQNASPAAAAARDKARAIEARGLPPVADDKARLTPEASTKAIKDAALAAGADQVGITRLRQDLVFDGRTLDYDWIIVLAVRMDYEPLAQAPSIATSVEVMDKYARGASAAYDLAAWIRAQGWDAEYHGGPKAGPVLLIPHAIAAGLGQLGKHGSMINRAFGSSFRLACVVTDLPLIVDREDDLASDDFCQSCQACTNACPPRAITDAKHRVRGDTKWYVDFDKCILYFNEHQSCAICLAVCPWSRPGVAASLADKMARRRARAAATGSPVPGGAPRT
jgi:ferredoxin